MISCRLGDYYDKMMIFEDLEKDLIKFKLSKINEYMSFGDNPLDFLGGLNLYLFNDLYELDNDPYRNRNDIKTMNIIKEEFDKLNISCIKKDIDELALCLERLWNIQALKVGNTRTIIGLLLFLNCAYELNLEINLDFDIKSSECIFKMLFTTKQYQKK